MVKIDCVVEGAKDGYLTLKYRRSPDVEVGVEWLTGSELTAVIEKKQDIRSLPMNDIIHWLFRQIAHHDLTDFETVKNTMKDVYGAYENVEGRLAPKSTAHYSVKEAMMFIDCLFHHCIVDLQMDVNPGTEMFQTHQEYLRSRREQV